MAYGVFDRGVTDRQWAFRYRLVGLLGDIRQPRLVLLLGAGRGGIDIPGGGILRGGTPWGDRGNRSSWA